MKDWRYGVFSGRVRDRRAETDRRTPHYHILLDGAGERFRVAVNTRSGTSRQREADLLYFADEDFRHPLTDALRKIDDGFVPVEPVPGGLALDYQRGGMFDYRHMRRVPSNLPGPRNDLVDELDEFVKRAEAESENRLHAYGTRWGPERRPDQIFGFQPGNGIHDVHMNQGNRDEHWHDNGTWADGGLIFHEPRRDRWRAIFLAFQTQTWLTDRDGNPVPDRSDDGRGSARIDGDDEVLLRPQSRQRRGLKLTTPRQASRVEQANEPDAEEHPAGDIRRPVDS